MSKEIKKDEPEETKSNKKYIILALVVILAIIGIMSGNGKEDETATVNAATTEQATVAEETPIVAETPAETEPTVARIDITTPLVNADEPQFEVYIDNLEIPEKQIAWLPKFGMQGYVVQRKSSKIDILIKTINDAKISFSLKGPDKRDENKKFIPVWVKYTSLKVDGKEILSQAVEVWHNKPFKYVIAAESGDNHQLHIEWQELNSEPE